jgi:hypothetical protein
MLNAIPIKILQQDRKVNLKVHLEGQNKIPQTAKAILSQKSNAGGIAILDFKQYYTAIVINTA